MKFYTYLNESNKVNVDKLQQCINDIKKNCKPFLKEWTSFKNPECLYRGSDLNIGVYAKKKVRKGRVPKDTIEWFHNMSNDIFKDIFNIKLRSDTLFTTGSIRQAEEYGDIFAVFPIGKYEIYWSKEIKDFYSYYDETMCQHDAYELEMQAKGDFIDREWDPRYGTFLYKDNEYEAVTIEEVIENIQRDYPDDEYSDIRKNMGWSSHIDEDEFVDNYIENAMDELKEELYHNFKTFYMKGDLNDALMYGHEIMLDCKEYYIVKKDYIPFLTDYFMSITDRSVVTQLYKNNKNIVKELE